MLFGGIVYVICQWVIFGPFSGFYHPVHLAAACAAAGLKPHTIVWLNGCATCALFRYARAATLEAIDLPRPAFLLAGALPFMEEGFEGRVVDHVWADLGNTRQPVMAHPPPDRHQVDTKQISNLL